MVIKIWQKPFLKNKIGHFTNFGTYVRQENQNFPDYLSNFSSSIPIDTKLRKITLNNNIYVYVWIDGIRAVRGLILDGLVPNLIRLQRIVAFFHPTPVMEYCSEPTMFTQKVVNKFLYKFCFVDPYREGIHLKVHSITKWKIRVGMSLLLHCIICSLMEL